MGRTSRSKLVGSVEASNTLRYTRVGGNRARKLSSTGEHSFQMESKGWSDGGALKKWLEQNCIGFYGGSKFGK